MTSRSAVLACALVLLAVACQAKPYHHSKKSHFPSKVDDSPFAPPAFYEDDEQYQNFDTKWMNWKPKNAQKAQKEIKQEETGKPLEKTEEKLAEKKQDDFVEQKDLSINQLVDEVKFPDPCKNVYCKYGRICQTATDGAPECACAGPDFCAGHSKEVCGSDGMLYPSHCELHRVACIKDMHIGIDHEVTHCKKPADKKDDDLALLPLSIVATAQVTDEQSEVKVDEHAADLIVEKKADKEQPVPIDIEVKKPEIQELIATKSPLTEDLIKPAEEDYGYKSVTEIRTPCEELEYERLKNNLLQYHCARIGEMDCTTDPAKKQFVANIMFNYYDLNGDSNLTEADLEEISHRDHLDKLSRYCRLTDFLTFNDRDADNTIVLNEFYNAFKIPTVALDDSLKVFTSMVTAGNSVELKCDIKGAVEIIWRRNGGSLDELISDDIQIFEDGSLYLKNIGLHHIGNYTCQDKYEETIQQTHVLKVQMLPEVKVSPSTQFHTSGASVTLKCHAEGIPMPEVSWEMNELPLPEDPDNKHFILMHDNATLEIKRATYTKDTGAYKCKARNSAGISQDIATVFIENSNVPKYSDASLHEIFMVFHDQGYTIYEPNHCHIEHQVAASFGNMKLLPEYGDAVHTLCKDDVCDWGSAVNVNNQFVYVSQPSLHRVIVIELTNRNNPLEVIPTDKYPVKLHYVEHLDQVWVLCWNQLENTGSKTAVVIRQASEHIQHHTVHTQPIGNRFDLINDFYLPLSNDLHHHFHYGYVAHSDQQGLYKLDLESMQYVKNIDLRQYHCVPNSVAFIPMGGQVIVHCVAPLGEPEQTSRLVLDYVTDQVLEHTALGGVPYVTPDIRYLVTVETDGNTISVSKVKDDGKMEHTFDEYTNLHISDVTFFPSDRGHGYDFFASATNKNDILYINLDSGKVEMIEGVGQPLVDEKWPWDTKLRTIISGGRFGEFLMTPAKDSVVVINGIKRSVQCEWQNIKHAHIIVWVDPIHL